MSTAYVLLPVPSDGSANRFLALAFVLTGLRYQTGFFVLEVWQAVLVLCLSVWAIEIVRSRRLKLDLDEVGRFALAVVGAGWLSYLGALNGFAPAPSWKRCSETASGGRLPTATRARRTLPCSLFWCWRCGSSAVRIHRCPEGPTP